jgi:SSS family solute:Na+ symporter
MLQYIGQYNFLYASGWLLVISVTVIVVVSLLTKPPSLQQIENLTYSTATDAQRKENRESWNKWDVIVTVVILGLVLGMYLYFSFWLR